MSSPTRGVIVLHNKDNVATIIFDLEPQSTITLVGGKTLALQGPVPAGHKLALKDLQEKDEIIKYGEVIGAATEKILAGQHVHVHNVQSLRGRVME